jgi:3-deoxy-7-phosphoheptulonate synthase
MSHLFTSPCIAVKRLPSPESLKKRYGLAPEDEVTIQRHRFTIDNILQGRDPRLLAFVGPCSIHDLESGLEYAKRLQALAAELDQFFIVMRVYFEKPRTSSGWKGLIIDPDLTGQADIEKGFTLARSFLCQLVRLGMPIATEVIDPLTPSYIEDCISWAAIGARTAESPTHRHLASGLPMPVGFKNTTSGSIRGAIFGMEAARNPQTYLAIDPQGHASSVTSTGNAYVHLVLRGGTTPNYDAQSIQLATQALKEKGFNERLVVDCSHGNSQKDHRKQPIVFRAVLAQLLADPHAPIAGIMLESHLNEGRQDLAKKEPLQYGVSITDSCLGWEATESLLREANTALRGFRLTGSKEKH